MLSKRCHTRRERARASSTTEHLWNAAPPCSQGRLHPSPWRRQFLQRRSLGVERQGTDSSQENETPEACRASSAPAAPADGATPSEEEAEQDKEDDERASCSRGPASLDIARDSTSERSEDAPKWMTRRRPPCWRHHRLRSGLP